MPTSARSSGGGAPIRSGAPLSVQPLRRSAANVSPRSGSWTTAATVSCSLRQAIETAHEPVTSPTYTIVHTYQAGNTMLHHVDLYRLDHTAEVDDLALPELLDDSSIMLVEWGDVVELGPQLHVELRVDDDDERVRAISLTSTDRRWALRWERLEAAVQTWSVLGGSGSDWSGQ